MNLQEKADRLINTFPEGQQRRALRTLVYAIIDDLEDHKAKFDAHTHSANDTAVVAGQQFQDVNLNT